MVDYFANCNIWKEEIFPALVSTTYQTLSAADSLIQKMSQIQVDLKQRDLLVETDVPSDIRDQIASAFNESQKDFLRILPIAEALPDKVKEFLDITRQVDQSVQVAGRSFLAETWPASSGIQNTLLRLESECSSIAGDLKTISEVQMEVDDPLLASLSLEDEIERWAQLKAEAEGFISQASSQRKILNGELRYEEAPVARDGRYVIKMYGNAITDQQLPHFLGPIYKKPINEQGVEGYYLMLGPLSEVGETCLYTFRPSPNGYGTYRIETEIMGSTYRLDVAPTPPFVILSRTRLKDSTSDWQFVDGKLSNPYFPGYLCNDNRRVMLVEGGDSLPLYPARASDYFQANPQEMARRLGCR